jgi:hypothetical protein
MSAMVIKIYTLYVVYFRINEEKKILFYALLIDRCLHFNRISKDINKKGLNVIVFQ